MNDILVVPQYEEKALSFIVSVDHTFTCTDKLRIKTRQFKKNVEGEREYSTYISPLSIPLEGTDQTSFHRYTYENYVYQLNSGTSNFRRHGFFVPTSFWSGPQCVFNRLNQSNRMKVSDLFYPTLNLQGGREFVDWLLLLLSNLHKVPILKRFVTEKTLTLKQETNLQVEKEETKILSNTSCLCVRVREYQHTYTIRYITVREPLVNFLKRELEHPRLMDNAQIRYHNTTIGFLYKFTKDIFESLSGAGNCESVEEWLNKKTKFLLETTTTQVLEDLQRPKQVKER